MEESTEFRECTACAGKPGSPVLCPSCLHNRQLVADLQEQLQKNDFTEFVINELPLISTSEQNTVINSFQKNQSVYNLSGKLRSTVAASLGLYLLYKLLPFDTSKHYQLFNTTLHFNFFNVPLIWELFYNFYQNSSLVRPEASSDKFLQFVHIVCSNYTVPRQLRGRTAIFACARDDAPPEIKTIFNRSLKSVCNSNRGLKPLEIYIT